MLTESSGQQVTLPLSSYSFGVAHSLSTGSQSSGVGAGKVTFSDFQITMKADASTPVLYEATAEGTVFAWATLAVPTLGGGAATFGFSPVGVTGISWGGDGGIPDESVTFDYAALHLSYAAQAGSPTSLSFGWNQVQNKVP